tara:strand:- start:75 stop:452 length:378 start_codon:yes stop_codon:yes gene_type:complete
MIVQTEVNEININEISNQLMMSFPGKSITPISQFEIKMDSSVFFRAVIRFMQDGDGKYYSRNHLFSLSLDTVRWGPTIIALLLSFSVVLSVPIIAFMIYDWLQTHRWFGEKLDQYFAQQGYLRRD